MTIIQLYKGKIQCKIIYQTSKTVNCEGSDG